MSTVRVLQFNLRFGQSGDDVNPENAPVNLDRTIAEIRSHGADSVLLREVEQAGLRGLPSDPRPDLTRLRAARGAWVTREVKGVQR